MTINELKQPLRKVEQNDEEILTDKLEWIVIDAHRDMYNSVYPTDVAEHEMKFGLNIARRSFKIGQDDMASNVFLKSNIKLNESSKLAEARINVRSQTIADVERLIDERIAKYKKELEKSCDFCEVEEKQNQFEYCKYHNEIKANCIAFELLLEELKSKLEGLR